MNIPYPHIEQINDEEYKLIEDYSANLLGKFEIHVKKDFIYDGASIPRLFWTLVGSPFTGTHTRAAFIHDALYASELLPREEADWLFLEILQECGCGWFKRNLMWSSVRIFGSSVWAKHTIESVKKALDKINIIGL